MTWCLRAGYAALIWQKIWPAILPFITVILAYMAFALSGFWLVLTPTTRVICQALSVLALVWSLWPLLREIFLRSWPTAQGVISFLDQGQADAPLMSINDKPSTQHCDALTEALWHKHQERLRLRLATLRPRLPTLDMTRRDPYALRHIVLIALIGAVLVAGSDWKSRLASSMIAPERLQLLTAFRLDGWIDPPAYTRLSPIVIEASDSAKRDYRVPIGSHVLIRFAGLDKSDVSVKTRGGLQPAVSSDKQQPSQERQIEPKTSGLTQHRFKITQDGRLELKGHWLTSWLFPTRTWTFAIIPDQHPYIAHAGEPSRSSRGNMELSYTASDDYGLQNIEALFESLDPEQTKRALIPPPRLPLNIPTTPLASTTEPDITKTMLEFADHPWAGTHVNVTLVARDKAGQETRTAPKAVQLPMRTFHNPLALALAELRRDLALNRTMSHTVQKALEALMLEPELFMIKSSEYLGLRVVHQRLETIHRTARLRQIARSDEALLDITHFLWEMALRIEEGDLTDAERALKAAQEALDKALKEGGSPEDIARLSQELRQAMERFVKEMQAQNRLPQQSPTGARKQSSNVKTITPDQLADMLKRIEDLAKSGQHAEAQRLLEELKNIMNNLQTARPQRPLSPEERAKREAFQQSMKDIGELHRDQETLRDETFRNQPQADSNMNQPDLFNTPFPPNPFSPQRQTPQRQDQAPNQSGKNKDDAPQTPSLETLKQRQEALKKRLNEIKKRLADQGIDMKGSLDNADEAMKDAQGKLGQGEPEDAVSAQGQALEHLSQTQRQMAEQGQGEGEGEGESADHGEGSGDQQASPDGRSTPREDPLGRQTRDNRQENGRFTRQGSRSNVELRLEEVIKELRKRLGDPTRARDEIDYLERLLKPR
jgi:uncharacterized protein (TIGR02302 family)